MLLTFPDLLARFSADPRLGWDDADPVAYHDQADQTTWMGEVRIGKEDEPILCAVARVVPDLGWRSVAQLSFQPNEGMWQVAGLTVTDKPVTADPESAISFIAALLAEIRAYRAPDIEALLLEHLGLTLPIMGYM